MTDPICGKCLHVKSEHDHGECTTTLPGGVPCEPHRYVEYAVYSAEQLRMAAADLLGRADALDRIPGANR